MREESDNRPTLAIVFLCVGLPLLLASAIGWVTSYGPDQQGFGIDGDASRVLARSYRGTIALGWIHFDPTKGEEFHRAGLYRDFQVTWGWFGHIAFFPYWVIVLPLFISSLLALRRVVVWALARKPIGVRCVRCGYDLRASPKRCPECGRAATSQPRGICCVVRVGRYRYILKRVSVGLHPRARER